MAPSIRVHFHPGRLVIERDVDAIVVDPPSIRSTEVRCRSSWASRLGGEINPARLAVAARSRAHDPQAVKWLWHCMARFGRKGTRDYEANV